jgi:hypothetical protein
VGDEHDSRGKLNLDLAYERAGQSYEAITEFRAKLLALLPLATGTGAFLLLERAQADASQFRRFLGPIGIFSVVVTLGLFAYELRGMQRCQRLEVQASVLEKDLKLSAEQGPFLGRPGRAFGNMLGPPAAGLMIYLATMFAWFWLAGYGFYWWGVSDAWGLLVGYGVVLTVAWVGLRWWLQQTATGELPTRWKKYRIDLPPMKPTWTSELTAARRRLKEAASKQELTAALDQAELEYLRSLYEALVDNRIPTAARDSQPGKRYRMRH